MEIYSKTTRFALACNDSSKIIGKRFAEIIFESLCHCRTGFIVRVRCAAACMRTRSGGDV